MQAMSRARKAAARIPAMWRGIKSVSKKGKTNKEINNRLIMKQVIF